MSFIHMHFRGQTTSPWHIGKRKYGDYLYTRDDYLWGRGIRGPVLRQLWRTFCPKSDARDRVEFNPEKDCLSCITADDCPFHNLIGSADEGEFKDKPRLIITNLRFTGNVNKSRVALATLDERHLGVVEGKAPVFVEYLLEGASFEFEAILMGKGAKFADHFESAVKTSLQFFGWGGFCNEGFGRGAIASVEKSDFSGFDHKYITPTAKKILERLQKEKNLVFDISPILILDKDGGNIYKSVFEEGFQNKLCNCINERYWQFYGENIYIQSCVERVSGRARTVRIDAWSRALGKPKPFEGVGHEIILHFKGEVGNERAKAFALAKYGVGRYKNQGFGSLLLVAHQK